MILTLGCGKFRIFDQDFGGLPGTDLPRLLDMGQCNDAYSALVVATGEGQGGEGGGLHGLGCRAYMV